VNTCVQHPEHCCPLAAAVHCSRSALTSTLACAQSVALRLLCMSYMSYMCRCPWPTLLLLPVPAVLLPAPPCPHSCQTQDLMSKSLGVNKVVNANGPHRRTRQQSPLTRPPSSCAPTRRSSTLGLSTTRTKTAPSRRTPTTARQRWAVFRVAGPASWVCQAAASQGPHMLWGLRGCSALCPPAHVLTCRRTLQTFRCDERPDQEQEQGEVRLKR